VQFTLNSSNPVVEKERTPPEVFFLRVRSPPSLWRRKVTWVRSFRTCETIEHEHEHEHEIRVGAQYVSHAARAKLPETNMNMNTNTRKEQGLILEAVFVRVIPAYLRITDRHRHPHHYPSMLPRGEMRAVSSPSRATPSLQGSSAVKWHEGT